MFTIRSVSPKAPVTDPALARAGLVLCSHGVRSGPGAAAAHAEAIRKLGVFAETRVACLNGRPDLTSVIQDMRAPRIFLVPFLMAEGYTAQKILGRIMGDEPESPERTRVCRPVGTHPRISEVLSASALRCCRDRGWPPRETSLIVMGHGTRRNANSGGTAWRHAQAIARRRDFAAVGTAFLDQPPSLESVLTRTESPHTVVVGLFADGGSHGESDVPRILERAGHDAAYAGPIGIAPEMPQLILDQVLEKEADVAQQTA